MARNDRAIRLEVVKRALAQSRRGIAIKALADKHNWKFRTLYRDIETMQAACFPVVVDSGRYRLDVVLREDLLDECRRRGLPAPEIVSRRHRGVPGLGLLADAQMTIKVAMAGPSSSGAARTRGRRQSG